MIIVDYDCDCYYYDENNYKQVLFKFRKMFFAKLCELGIECLKEAAKTHDNLCFCWKNRFKKDAFICQSSKSINRT